ncbi:alpha-L-fucosidase [bacterium]|nr:alpha-L-fucosidase [bacterium]
MNYIKSMTGKGRTISALLGALGIAVMSAVAADKSMDKMWGSTEVGASMMGDDKAALFDNGNYGMFIHWGLYSNLAGKWDGKTYYGIGEWIMNPRVAGIPPKEYMKQAGSFNPADFDARAIAQLAVDAGMKWIIITSKHHEGFAMFDSEHPFNVVDATPFGRDPMKELADACKEFDLGFGFYYSHNQDWTSPGGNGGPKTNADGSEASFEQYFREKCFPQVKEICTNYGPLNYIWFDTPGNMPKHFVEELSAYVREVQPNAMLCSRIGHGLGDYISNGDMQVPPRNMDGLWETCDTTNDSWSYAWYDENWKGTGEILARVVSTVARGGTYLLNVGPDGNGSVPAEAAKFLRRSGEWIKRYPQVVYAAGSSPWGRALPWGDVTTQGETMNLVVYDWPQDGRLFLPGLQTKIESAAILTADGEQPIKWAKRGTWTELQVPLTPADHPASVIKVTLAGAPVVDQTHGVHPNTDAQLLVEFAAVEGATKEDIRWMEKFGEWKHVNQVSDWDEDGSVVWDVDVLEAGDYQVELRYKGEGRLTWRVDSDEGDMLQNNQNSSHVYSNYTMGQLHFKAPGKHSLSVSLVDGDPAKSSLAALRIYRVD